MSWGGYEKLKVKLRCWGCMVVSLFEYIAFTYPLSLVNPLLTHLHTPKPPSWPSSPQKLQGSIAQFMAFTSIQLHIQHSYTHAFHIQVLTKTNQVTLMGCYHWMKLIKKWDGEKMMEKDMEKKSHAQDSNASFWKLWHLAKSRSHLGSSLWFSNLL